MGRTRSIFQTLEDLKQFVDGEMVRLEPKRKRHGRKGTNPRKKRRTSKPKRTIDWRFRFMMMGRSHDPRDRGIGNFG